MASATSHPQGQGLEEALQHAFEHGPLPASADLLVHARRAGLDWEAATAAAARGIARRYGDARSETVDRLAAVGQAARHDWRGVALGLLVYILLRPPLGFGHEAVVAAIGRALHAVVASGAWRAALAHLPLDPVYAGAAVAFAGGVRIQGFAAAGPLGAWLHDVLPALFLAPGFVAPGAAVSAVAAPGATAIGRGLAAFGADVIWLAIGLRLLARWRRGHVTLGTLGLLIQAQIVVNHLLDAPVALRDLEAAGIPFAFSLLSPGRGPWFTDAIRRMPEQWQAMLLAGGLTLVAYLCALLPFAGVGLARLAIRLTRRGRRQPRRPTRPAIGRAPLWAAAALAVAAATSPVGALAMGATNWRTSDPLAAVPLATRTAPAFRAMPLGNPSVVRVEQGPDGAWRYLVDGQPTVVRGVGYNPRYALLGPEERGRLYDRDFEEMRQAGVNTIEGWFESEFDAVTLDHAAANDLGVIVPIELDRSWDYADPAVQARILRHVAERVAKLKNAPALRFWAAGNEDLHGIISPTWGSQEGVVEARARADAFAAFMPTLVDAIHQADPDHPVVYRDAEDIYLPRLKDAFARTGVARPWLVYGANVYTDGRLREIVDQWPNQWVGGPLLVSEFAPGGMGPADRPLGFVQDWSIIRSRPDLVLGGLAYTWATNGPEELDRVFGLVQPNGQPADDALAALGAAYLGDRDPSS